MSIFDRPIAVIIQDGKPKSERLAQAVLTNHSGVVLREPERIPEDYFPVVIGAWKTTAHWLHKFRREQIPFIYCDNGFFKPYPHGPYFRATLNGLQYIPYATRVRPTPRWESLGIPIRNWRTDGRHILVTLQTSQWFSMMGLDRETWLAQTLAELGQHTDREIKIREKPGKRTLNSPTTTFSEDLVGAHAVVSFSSNTLLEATMAGVPIFPRGLCASTPLGCNDLKEIESPLLPYREYAYEHLANAQWTLEEIADGLMWRTLREGNPASFQDLA